MIELLSTPKSPKAPLIPGASTMIRAAAVALLAGAMILLGCAKPQTQILTTVSADATVPPLLIVEYTVTSTSNPTHHLRSGVVSQAPGDAADGRAPFVFPMILRVGPLPGWSGAVEIMLVGRDYGTDKIIASGQTTADVVPEKDSTASVTLTAASDLGDGDGDGDADAGADGGSDGGADDDAASDATSDT